MISSSLLGISYYLEKNEWKKLVEFTAGIMPKGSAMCFDFPSKEESEETKVNKILASGAEEQMKAQYSYEKMAALLSECGFRAADHLTAEEMTKLYFADYNKHTPGHPMSAPPGVDYIFAVRE